MRLLCTVTGQFIEIQNPNPKRIEYAILSHTWDRFEQTYQELREIQKDYQLAVLDESSLDQVPYPPVADQALSSPSTPCELDYFDRIVVPHASSFPSGGRSLWKDRRLSRKVKEACAVAREYGYRLLWIDSCCIDKTSSAELSEAINSMYPWYRDADICFAYLADVPNGDDPFSASSKFRSCRWFGRGWTLQELLAPLVVMFLSEDWNFYGTVWKLADVIEEVTHIEAPVLTHQIALRDVSVATRMSWASRRETTRVEDRAYSLLGIFDINMPTLYGEGKRAFLRLQEEILRRIPDQSLFVWGIEQPPRPVDISAFGRLDKPIHERPSILAAGPTSFRASRSIRPVPHNEFAKRVGKPDLPYPTYTSTPFGLRIQFPLIKTGIQHPSPDGDGFLAIAVLACEMDGCLLAFPCCVDDRSQIRRVLLGSYGEPSEFFLFSAHHFKPSRIMVPVTYADAGWTRQESAYDPTVGVPMIHMRRMQLMNVAIRSLQKKGFRCSSRLVPYDKFIVSLAHSSDGREVVEIHFSPQRVGTAISATVECTGQYFCADRTRSLQVVLDPPSGVDRAYIDLFSESGEKMVLDVAFQWSRACWLVHLDVALQGQGNHACLESPGSGLPTAVAAVDSGVEAASEERASEDVKSVEDIDLSGRYSRMTTGLDNSRPEPQNAALATRGNREAVASVLALVEDATPPLPLPPPPRRPVRRELGLGLTAVDQNRRVRDRWHTSRYPR